MSTYIISDTHFFDENIINFCNRPFSDIFSMNEFMIEKWNEIVGENDETYIVGDFAISNKEKIKEILSKLNGKKYLIIGNHDTYSVQEYIHMGFAKVYDFPIILDEFWILSHNPMFMNETMPYVNIFGHIHNSPLYKDYSKQHFCGCGRCPNELHTDR